MTAITLPPLPHMTHYGGTATVVSPEHLRARDLEVARCVLEAAANIATANREPWTAKAIRALEFHHHE